MTHRAFDNLLNRSISQQLTDLDDAIHYFEECLQIKRGVHTEEGCNNYEVDDDDVVEILKKLASVCALAGRYETAMDYYTELLELTQSNNEKSKVLRSLAMVSYKLGFVGDAKDFYDQSLQLRTGEVNDETDCPELVKTLSQISTIENNNQEQQEQSKMPWIQSKKKPKGKKSSADQPAFLSTDATFSDVSEDGGQKQEVMEEDDIRNLQYWENHIMPKRKAWWNPFHCRKASI